MSIIAEFYKKNNEIFAYFPNKDYENSGGCKIAYSKFQKHHPCHPLYVKGLKLLKYNEYSDLLKVLIHGRYVLDIVNLKKQTIEAHRKPTKTEMKFGEGATHYRTFTLLEVGLNKNGDIKKRFKADDNLIYSTK